MIFKKLKMTKENPLYARIDAQGAESLEYTFSSNVTIISGKNGAGKSTLMEIVRRAAFGENSEGLEVQSTSVPHYFFSIKDMAAKNMIRDADAEMAYDPQFLATWMDRQRMSHGQMNHDTLSDVGIMAKSGDPVVFFIDEPELGLDAINLIALVDMMKSTPTAQFVVITHHPFILLDDSFDHIEMSPGYRDSVRQQIDRVIKVPKKATAQC